MVFDYIDGGADAEWTMRENSRVFEEMAETRAIKALQEAPAPSDFPLEATVEWNAPASTKTGAMRVVAKLDSVLAVLPANKRGDSRVTMAVQVAPRRASAVSSLMANDEVADGTFRFRAPVNIPLSATSLSLVIEELNTVRLHERSRAVISKFARNRRFTRAIRPSADCSGPGHSPGGW